MGGLLSLWHADLYSSIYPCTSSSVCSTSSLLLLHASSTISSSPGDQLHDSRWGLVLNTPPRKYKLWISPVKTRQSGSFCNSRCVQRFVEKLQSYLYLSTTPFSLFITRQRGHVVTSPSLITLTWILTFSRLLVVLVT